jgi:phage baseplate assembly protein W
MTRTNVFGLGSPLRRDLKRDFAAVEGADLLVSKVRQVLATEGATSRSSGELPWRTSFGSALHLLRHQRNEVALVELARVHVREALRRWLPEVQVVDISVESVDSTFTTLVRLATRTGAPVVVPLDLSSLAAGGGR